MDLEQEIAQLEWAMRAAERDCEADFPGVWDRGGWVDYARSLLQFSPEISTEAKREFCRMQGLEFREEYQ